MLPRFAEASPHGVPDWGRIHRELDRKGVTLMLLWQEHVAEHPHARTWRYTQICEHYKAFAGRLKRSMRQRNLCAPRKSASTPSGCSVGVAEAEADLADLYDERGNLKHPNEWPTVWRNGLALGVETFQAATGEADENGKPSYATLRKVNLAIRIRQIELIGKHVRVSAFREQVGVSIPQGGPVQVDNQATARLGALLARARGNVG